MSWLTCDVCREHKHSMDTLQATGFGYDAVCIVCISRFLETTEWPDSPTDDPHPFDNPSDYDEYEAWIIDVSRFEARLEIINGWDEELSTIAQMKYEHFSNLHRREYWEEIKNE